jgi:hypothetical protein
MTVFNASRFQRAPKSRCNLRNFRLFGDDPQNRTERCHTASECRMIIQMTLPRNVTAEIYRRFRREILRLASSIFATEVSGTVRQGAPQSVQANMRRSADRIKTVIFDSKVFCYRNLLTDRSRVCKFS